MSKTADTKFFTNDNNSNLYNRFNDTLKNACYFDALVGYFRTSGFHRIYKSLNEVKKIRILVGINTDYETYKLIQEVKQINFLETQVQTKQYFNRAVVNEFDNSEDSFDVEESVAKFIELLKSNRLEIKAFPSDKIHAKVYITRYSEPVSSVLEGSVVTGSSNFTENGLNAQYEFNVELKDPADYKFALNKFEELWAIAVDVSAEYIETINSKTWLNNEITPYEIYLKFLYEYFYEDINAEETLEVDLPDNYMRLNYQINAISTINRIVESYGGVFISDVVGLGKTYICAMYAQILNGRKLILSPPPVIDNWKGAMHDFGVKKYTIESIGMLHKIVEKIQKTGENEYDYIFIDEAHRFRNGDTNQYELLKRLCLNKKVILISATPLNNSFYDFKALITLFQKANDCDIPGIPGRNLDAFFTSKRNYLKETEKLYGSKNHPDYINAVKSVSKEVRTKILNHIMVRRTRTDIKNRFEKDMKKQGLSFPEVKPPQRIIYEFDKNTNRIFEQTIEMITVLSYARYTPRLYLDKQLSAFEIQQQANLKGFMKSRFVKRLESSKYAFEMTLKRTIESYEKYIKMYNSGFVYISKDVNIFDYIDNDNTDDLDNLINSYSDKKVEKFSSESFNEGFIDNLNKDLELLEDTYEKWNTINKDYKREQFINVLKENELLSKSKIVVFTESKETGEDLFETLQEEYGEGVLFYSSSHSASIKEVIKENFDPSSKSQADDIRILITTDVLAEGINLHRSNVIINYDLPWNPTRVLQRVGRVNRVGTKHNSIHIFNIFPTAKADKELDLESNIIAKIQAFHNALGEDAKYLSEEEEFTSYDLRGAGKRIFEDIENAGSSEDEEENIELKYLSIIRDIRDKDTALFKKIGLLPKKIRTARKFIEVTNNSLITFFRKGRLKKFAITKGAKPQEIAFEDAVKYFECEKREPRKDIPRQYYEYLESNKKLFDSQAYDDENVVIQKGRSNKKDVVNIIKNELLREDKFTQSDKEYLQSIIKAYDLGVIPTAITKRLKVLFNKEFNSLKLLASIKVIVPDGYLNTDTKSKKSESTTKEIVLSQFLYKNEG